MEEEEKWNLYRLHIGAASITEGPENTLFMSLGLHPIETIKPSKYPLPSDHLQYAHIQL